MIPWGTFPVKIPGNVAEHVLRNLRCAVPRDGHIFQMVAYFLILSEMYPNMDIPYGVLKYKNQAFRIDNIPENRSRLLGIVDEMRAQFMEPERNHSNSGRCFKCSFNEVCQQKLISSKQ